MTTAISPVNVLIDVATGLIVVVLLWAGLSKLRFSHRTLKAMKELGIPHQLQHRWIAALVPIVEIGLAALLLCAPGPARLIGSISAVILFGVFTFYITRAAARGEQVSCECFGSVSHDPIDRYTVARNVLLVVVALAATGVGLDGSILLLSLDLPRLLVMAAVAVVTTLISIIIGQRRHVNRLRSVINDHADRYRRRSNDPLTGSPIPDAEVVSINGTTRTLAQLAHRRTVLLVFAKSGCGDCDRVIRSFSEWGTRLNGVVKPVVVTSSDPEVLFAEHPEIIGHTYFGASAARKALGVRTVPTAVLLAAGGTSVATEVVEGSSAIADLVAALEEVVLANSTADGAL